MQRYVHGRAAPRRGVGRRVVLQGIAVLGAGGIARAQEVTLPFANGERSLVTYPQKRPLIRQTARPPQLETPFAVYDEGVLTPNDAFFVRYHLSGLPLDRLDADRFRLSVSGHIARPLDLSLAELKAMPETEIVAVNQCSGNSRGLFLPRVAGSQAANGMMGNARWSGVALKTVLDRAGVKAGAVQVAFDGMDEPPTPATPDFVKALDIDHARDGEVMLAWSMNGADLPVLNGYPLRLAVPGYYGTYWVKHVDRITVLDQPLANFWMANAYRIPDNACACIDPGTKLAKTRPVGRYDVRSFITSPADGARLPTGGDVALRGIAFDGGSGIRSVEVSADGGASWSGTTLGEDLGKYSFRGWHTSVRLAPGSHELKVRATANSGETQPAEARWNPAGYMRNVIETVRVQVA
jgi:sulfite dehydrogenase (cytochrome) subunit A